MLTTQTSRSNESNHLRAKYSSHCVACMFAFWILATWYQSTYNWKSHTSHRLYTRRCNSLFLQYIKTEVDKILYQRWSYPKRGQKGALSKVFHIPGGSVGVPEMLLVMPDCAAIVTCNSSSARFIKLFTSVFVFAIGCDGFWVKEFTSWKNFSLMEKKVRSQLNTIFVLSIKYFS